MIQEKQTSEEIAQWVIDNRYKSVFKQISEGDEKKTLCFDNVLVIDEE